MSKITGQPEAISAYTSNFDYISSKEDRSPELDQLLRIFTNASELFSFESPVDLKRAFSLQQKKETGVELDGDAKAVNYYSGQKINRKDLINARSAFIKYFLDKYYDAAMCNHVKPFSVKKWDIIDRAELFCFYTIIQMIPTAYGIRAITAHDLLLIAGRCGHEFAVNGNSYSFIATVLISILVKIGKLSKRQVAGFLSYCVTKFDISPIQIPDADSDGNIGITSGIVDAVAKKTGCYALARGMNWEVYPNLVAPDDILSGLSDSFLTSFGFIIREYLKALDVDSNEGLLDILGRFYD